MLSVAAQVAGQQGAYVARMINRGYTMGVGGLDVAPPVKIAPENADKVCALCNPPVVAGAASQATCEQLLLLLVGLGTCCQC